MKGLDDERETVFNITFCIKKVELQDFPDKERNVFMVLLTNITPERKDPKAAYKIVETYLPKCKCDEFYQYIKQSYNQGDVGVRSNNNIRNMAAIVYAIAYLTNVYMRDESKTQSNSAQGLYSLQTLPCILCFRHYAIADDILRTT